LEGKTDNLEKKVDAGFADVKLLIFSLFGACVTLIAVMFGVIVWDRRSISAPQTKTMNPLIKQMENYQTELQTLKDQLITKGSL
jgi:hypothetical protein